MAWTEVYQNTDNMQATSLFGLLLFRIDIGNRNEVYTEALLATVKKHFQEGLLVECGWFPLCGHHWWRGGLSNYK